MDISPTLKLEKLQADVHAALRAWRDLDGTPQNLLEQLLLVQAQRKNTLEDSPMFLRLATNQVLLQCIKTLEHQDQQSAQIIQDRFLDDKTISMVSQKLELSDDQVKRRQRDAIQKVASILLNNETSLRETRVYTLEARLFPPSYTALFGVEEALQTITEKLLPGNPWIVTILGIGGIGKTSLADAAVRRIIRHFCYEQVAWLRIDTPLARRLSLSPTAPLDTLMGQLAQKLCPHLPPETDPKARDLEVRQTLKATPYLIAIDNLEVEAETAFLMEHLNDLANPSKFLVTTRTRSSSQMGIYTHPLQELSPESAAALIRHHASNSGIQELAHATAAEIEEIYQVTGGNPLALKLVSGMTTALPLAHILQDFVQVQFKGVEEMYRRIYWKTWQSLSDNARTLLEMMPVASHMGIELEQMLAVSGLTTEQLLPAISELVNRSLLEVGGTAWKRRYSIHRLTETFLRTEIINLPEQSV